MITIDTQQILAPCSPSIINVAERSGLSRARAMDFVQAEFEGKAKGEKETWRKGELVEAGGGQGEGHQNRVTGVVCFMVFFRQRPV